MTGKSRELLAYLFVIRGIMIWSGINVWKQAGWLGKRFRIHTFKYLIAVEELAFLACSIHLVYKELQNSLTLKQLISSEAYGFWIDIIRVFKLHKACSIFPSVYRWKKTWEQSLGERKVLLLSRKTFSHVWKEGDPSNLSSSQFMQFDIRGRIWVRRKLLIVSYPCIVYHRFSKKRGRDQP